MEIGALHKTAGSDCKPRDGEGEGNHCAEWEWFEGWRLLIEQWLRKKRNDCSIGYFLETTIAGDGNRLRIG
jgi:hypothetical protein